MNEIKPDDVPPPARSVERVTLGPEEAEKVAAMLRQVEETSKGFLQLSRSDVVNFLVRERRPELSTRELQQIRHHHYDPVKHLNWLTPRLRDAIQKNDIATVQALQAELRNIELTVVGQAKDIASANASAPAPAPQVNRRKRGKNDAEILEEAASMKDLQDQLPEG